jgi:hypothetical protein
LGEADLEAIQRKKIPRDLEYRRKLSSCYPT